MLPLRINNITELQAEQDRLVADMRRTRKEFNKSADKTTNGTKDFLLKNILLPAGAIGLGIIIAKQISDSKPHKEIPEHGKEETLHTQESSGSGWFAKLMLVALPFVQQFFIGAKSAEAVEGEGETEGQHNGIFANSKMGILAMIVPVAVPILQQYFLKKEEESKEQVITFDNNGNEMPHASTATPKHGPAAIFEQLYKLLPVVLPLVQHFIEQKNKSAERDNAVYTRDIQYAGAVA